MRRRSVHPTQKIADNRHPHAGGRDNLNNVDPVCAMQCRMGREYDVCALNNVPLLLVLQLLSVGAILNSPTFNVLLVTRTHHHSDRKLPLVRNTPKHTHTHALGAQFSCQTMREPQQQRFSIDQEVATPITEGQVGSPHPPAN